jgi:hypothetical protein
MVDPAPLILTLAMDEASFGFLDRQRRQYFPPDRNFIPAHVTLFHALPGTEIDSLLHDVMEMSRRQQALDLAATGLRLLGRGVAYTLVSPGLLTLRATLAERWSRWLTPQDRQSYRPHVTIQNKVDPAVAKATFTELQASFTPVSIVGEGLHLWHYRGGPWEEACTVRFEGCGSDPTGS